MAEIVVAAQGRSETGKNANRQLRAEGRIPAVLYGKGQAATAISVAPRELATILRSGHGESMLFDLELDGKRRKVVLKDFQVEPIKTSLLHADFYEVALDRAITVNVHVELTGTPVGVKTQGGKLEFVSREIEVECLPLDIPEKIVVDVTNLELGKHIRVQDLAVPKGVTFLTGPEVVVVHVVTIRGEEEGAAPAEGAAAAAAPAEPEVIKKGKGETAEGGEKTEKKPEKAEKKPEKKEKK